MPVPESYASRRYAGREETTYSSTYSQTRSATRPGVLTPSFTSKLASSTLPPRPSFERKSSIESSSSSSRYLSGSRTIPSYGTPSIIRGAASPNRATTSILRREVPSVSDRIKSYDSAPSGEKEFVSRFLRPREATVAPTTSFASKSNAYLTSRERSSSRDSGYSSSLLGSSSAHPVLGGRERERNVRGNIAARAASIGPSALSTRSSRNGHTTMSQQSSTEVTNKSNVSSATSSANVSRGGTPPKRNQTAPPICQSNASASQAIVGGDSNVIVNNRNDGLSASKIHKSAAGTTLSNGDIDIGSGQRVNENESTKRRERSVKMVTEIDSNGNAISSEREDSAESDELNAGTKNSAESESDCSVGTDKSAKKNFQSGGDFSHKNEKDEVSASQECHSNDSNLTCNGVESQHESSAQPETFTSKSNSIMTKRLQRRTSGSGQSTSGLGHQPPKLLPPANEFKQVPLKDDAVAKKVLPTLRYAGRQQSASPVRQLGPSKLRTPSPAKVVQPASSRSRESSSSISVNRKNSVGSVSSESKPSSVSSSSTSEGNGKTPRSFSVIPVPAASREQSLSRSPSPQLGVPKPPPLPDLYLNGKFESGEMNGHKNEDKGQKQRPGPSHRAGTTSDSSDNDGDNYNTSPTLGGRFRSSRDKNNDYEKEAGLSGLRNIGNTCFMNSVLQCLSNTKPLLEYIVRKNYSSDINNTTSAMKGALMRAFADLCLELWRESKSTVDTSAFKDQVQRFAPRFMGYSQQDAQEFLRYLLEGLHEDINRVDTKPPPILTEIDDSLSDSNKAAQSWKRYLRCDDSRVVDLFVGQLKSSLKCTTCGHCSVTFDPFWDLSLPIPSKTGQVKLSQCLELFTKEEILDGDEKPTCSKCATRRKCTKSFSIQKFPKILVIHLKRFSPTERYRGKLSTSVDFPLVGLDMTPYAASRSTGCVYNLYGVANHSGSTYSGHYVAYCKHPYTGDWHCYNDSRVSPISSQSVVSSDGYLLFYELTNSSD